MRKIYEIGLFRLALGLYLLYYQIILWSDFSKYFGPGSMVLPDLLTLKRSILFWCWNPLILKALFLIMMGLTLKFAFAGLRRQYLMALFILQISFHQANPLIIHEPQQLANLFLFAFFLFQQDYPPVFFKSMKISSDERLAEGDKQIVKVLVIFLGVYYFLAGIKKLPDPLWLKGEALDGILRWSMIGQDNFFVHQLLQHPLFLKGLNYFVLAFEMLFIFLVFSRFRWVLILVGIGYHLGIYLTMDVGSFSPIMMVWYALLFDEKTMNVFKNLINFKTELKLV